ncbi:general vesicular transport factor p115-like isoform X2 [Zophobas morio]|uniref:general vesicular transport factor p115-like isoform X2 n=1 Tax=Zophobas morio TaxID=2755281 RepID=UPI003082D561
MSLYWSNTTNSKVNGGDNSEVDKASEVISIICQKIKDSKSPEERKDYIRAIRAMVGSYQLEVGLQCMEILVEVLKKDRNELFIVEHIIEIFSYLFSKQGNGVEEGNQSYGSQNIALAFIEIFVRNAAFVEAVVELAAQPSFTVRIAIVRLLMKLLDHQCFLVQNAVIAVPHVLSRLLELLEDPRPPIRLDALLILTQLAKFNFSVQQILVFENAFRRIFDINCSVESHPGPVQLNSLRLIYELLRTNKSNQNFFRETHCFSRLNPFLENLCAASLESRPLLEEAVAAHLLILSVLRIFVHQTNPHVAVNQDALLDQGSFFLLRNVLWSPNFSGLPEPVRVSILYLVADCMRKNRRAQQFFEAFGEASAAASMSRCLPITSNPDHLSDVEDGSSAALELFLEPLFNPQLTLYPRLVYLYCLGAYLSDNPVPQRRLILFVLPREDSLSDPVCQYKQGDNRLPFTTLLFDTTRPVDSWLASLALIQSFRVSKPYSDWGLQLKHLLLDLNIHGVSFIRKLSNLFSFDGPGKVRIWCSGLLLLSSLLAECPVAVHRALREGPEIRSFLLEKSQSQPPTQLDCAFLSGLTSFTIGLCLLYSDEDAHEPLFPGGLDYDRLSRSIKLLTTCQPFKNAAENFEVCCHQNGESEVWFDHDFTVFCRREVPALLKCFEDKLQEKNVQKGERQSFLSPQFERLARAQEEEIRRLQQQLCDLLKLPDDSEAPELNALKKEIETLNDTAQYLTQQRELEENSQKV